MYFIILQTFIKEFLHSIDHKSAIILCYIAYILPEHETKIVLSYIQNQVISASIAS